MLKGDDMLLNLSERYSTAFLNGSRWFNQLLNVVRYAVPTADGLNILYGYNNSGEDTTYYISNNTTQIAADKRASDLHSLLLPSGRRWGEIYVDGQFDDAQSEKVFQILQGSNIHAIAHSIFLDLTIGCAGVWIDSPSKEEPISFRALTGVAILPEFNGRQEPENVWFKRSINDLELAKYRKDVDSYKSSYNQNYVTCGFIRNRDANNKPMYSVPNASNYEWLYIEVLQDEWKAPLKLEAMKFKHLHLINDTIRAGDSRGIGVALKMLNDIVYLNNLTDNLKNAIEFKSNPPIMGNEKLGNHNFRNLSGAILPSTLSQDGVPLLAPLQWDIDIPSIMEYKGVLEQKINTAFNVDPIGEMQKQPATATEINAREAEAQRQSLTDISRIVYDFSKVFDTCLDILKSRGILKGEIAFRNPMMDAENQVQLNNLVTYEQMMNQLLGPGSFAMFNQAVMTDRFLKDKLDIPTGLSKSKQQMEDSVAQMKALAQQNPELAQPTSQPTAINPTQLGQQQQITGRGI